MVNGIAERSTAWPDWVVCGTLDNFSKPLAAIYLPKSHTFLGDFCKGVKIFIFLVKSFLGNFYRNLAFFYWSHCRSKTKLQRELLSNVGSGCGSEGRAVASDARGPRFKFSHQQNLYGTFVYCQQYWKDENKEKSVLGSTPTNGIGVIDTERFVL